MEKSYEDGWNITPSFKSHVKTRTRAKVWIINKNGNPLPWNRIWKRLWLKLVIAKNRKIRCTRLENIASEEIYFGLFCPHKRADGRLAKSWQACWLWIWNDVSDGALRLIAGSVSAIRMGTACTKTQDAGQNSKYSVHNRVEETQGKPNFHISCSFYKAVKAMTVVGASLFINIWKMYCV